VLLKFDKDKEAANLQKLLSDLMQDMDNAKHEIWTVDLMQQPQMVSSLQYALDFHKCELGYVKIVVSWVMTPCSFMCSY
jgi:hypothetical protein